MKILVLQENLVKALSIVSRFVSPRVQLPILGNVLMSAEKGKLRLSATNLETGINLWLPVKVEKEGDITVPAKTFWDFISSLPQDKVSLEADQNKINVVCRNYKAFFNGMSSNEFPKIPSLRNKTILKDAKSISLDAGIVLEAIRQTAYAAAQDETRPALAGVKISFSDKKMQMMATDGYRLSLCDKNLEKTHVLDGLIIPAKTLLELSKGMEEDIKEVVLTKQDNQIIFSFNNTEIISRLIEGEFPDVVKIIPQEYLTKITIDKDELQNAIKAAAIFARSSANIIKLNIKNQKLKISANAPEVGNDEVELEVKQEGEDNQIAFNMRFLQDYLNSTKEKNILLEFSGPLKPGVFKSVKEDYIHIIMPVRIQE